MNQLSVMDYLGIKQEIKNQLNNIQTSFVVVGYKLKQVRDNGLYLQDGHKDIFEFGQHEFGLSRSTVSRFIAINDKFSIGGNSEDLQPQFKELGSSKLQEMLTLPDEYCNMITGTTTVQGIREVKRFAQDEKEAEPTPMERILKPQPEADAFSDQMETALLELYCNPKLETTFNGQIRGSEMAEDVAEQVLAVTQNVFRSGKVMLFLGDYRDGINIKILGESGKRQMSWQEFCDLFSEVFAEAKDHPADPWRHTFAQLVEKEKPVERKPEPKTQPKPQSKPQSQASKAKEIQKPRVTRQPESETGYCDFDKISGMATKLILAANQKNREKVLTIIQDLSAEIIFGTAKEEATV